MKTYQADQLKGKITTFGRTWYGTRRNCLYFNWSTGGLEFQFRGTLVSARFYCDCGAEIEGAPWDENAPRRSTWPWLMVMIDGQETRRFEVRPGNQPCLLFQSDTPQTHRLRIVKLTENFKTYAGLETLYLCGDLLDPPPAPVRKIEFVGDSITCGYGNATPERDRGFYPGEEDGWNAHGALAARMLGRDWSCVSISGITVAPHRNILRPYAMDELYLYTDRVGQLKAEPEGDAGPWDFGSSPNEAVVINLGTNDANVIVVEGKPEGEAAFERDYGAFLRVVRQANGPRTHIVCALGSMNYYLWDGILRVVERYRQETGDDRVYCFKYRPMGFMDGFGASGHPSLQTHEKMAAELAGFLRPILDPQRDQKGGNHAES